MPPPTITTSAARSSLTGLNAMGSEESIQQETWAPEVNLPVGFFFEFMNIFFGDAPGNTKQGLKCPRNTWAYGRTFTRGTFHLPEPFVPASTWSNLFHFFIGAHQLSIRDRKSVV